MASRIAEIVAFLANGASPRRAEIASLFLNSGGDLRDELAGHIETALVENRKLERARPLSYYGDVSVTFYFWSPSAPRLPKLALQHARVVLVANKENHRHLVELEYAEGGSLVAAHLTDISLDGIGDGELALVRKEAERFVERRLEQARSKGKIGRNDQCPCGSGRKFKRCHGR